ncbi:FAD/NAD(P)-binding domain-containing protein [Aaosphaeria arxii CBS 175.79]|uniref:FAD/NAD(P)-binding domain-containing protein n=1 Tax=Aaosphaeria arxii CBS 175.79 TaxID=1450172 RepID=A0A6A5XUR3_9PLEO|nr:FAD/NAD(P)-binding domain-containing protein [Aaosphaeria arxii CBS 175.79]KAF2016666.1 FAD/NAD(P)-binding domain-containing protein [Aaosphaeria arxii CBS 175.79]
MNSKLPIIIAGGGIVGLTLAQSLHKAKVPYQVFERDPSPTHNLEGWGLTVHWALPALEACLPPKLFARLLDIQVDPEQGINDTGRFLFLDLKTGEPKYVIPPSKRMRLHRRKLRALLREDLNIQWDKALHNFTQTSGSILAHFEDGTTIEGCLLIGADGSSSRTRRLLYAFDPDAGSLNQLPMRFMGTTMRLDPFQAQHLRDIDPLLFQGSHPDTGVFMWCSILSVPATNGSAGTGYNEYFEAQLMLSWHYRSAEDEVPATNRQRVQKMKAMAQNFDPNLRRIVWDVMDDAPVLEVKITDWLPREWDGMDNHVTLVGDAAHAMTMFRGEGFNHGITDAAKLGNLIVEAFKNGYDPDLLEQAVEVYEQEMRSRTYEAVLLSRQACLDAHDINNLSPDSPLVSKRARILEPGKKRVI